MAHFRPQQHCQNEATGRILSALFRDLLMPQHPDTTISPVLLEIFRHALNNPALQLRAEMGRVDVAGWDSMAHIRIVLEVEKKFKIRLAAQEIASFSTIGELSQLIARKCG